MIQEYAFWYCLKVLKRYTFHYFVESGSRYRKPELFWNISIVWYMKHINDIIFLIMSKINDIIF